MRPLAVAGLVSLAFALTACRHPYRDVRHRHDRDDTEVYDSRSSTVPPGHDDKMPGHPGRGWAWGHDKDWKDDGYDRH